MKEDPRRNESTITEKDESDTLSDSEMGVMVTYELEGQHSSAQLTSEERTKDEDDQTSGDGGNAGNLTDEHLYFCKEAPSRNRHRPHAIFGIMRSEESVVKIGVKIATHLEKTWLL